MTLEEVQQECATHMEAIQRLFKPGSKIALTIRFEGKPECDFLMTDDDLTEVQALLERRKTKEIIV